MEARKIVAAAVAGKKGEKPAAKKAEKAAGMNN